MSAKRSHSDDDESSEEDEGSSDEEEPIAPPVAAAAAAAAPQPAASARRVNMATLEQLKREKRLAMNRESARARRRRKKIRLETLEQRAEDLSQRHHNLVLTNQSLKTRVTQLETELAATGGGTGAGIGVGALGAAGGQDVTALAAAASLGMAAEQRATLALQQQAAMARMGGGAGSSAFGAGALGGAMMQDPHYLQQMQQQLFSSPDRSSRAAAAGGVAGGDSHPTASRLAALDDIQAQIARRNQLAAAAALRSAGAGGQIGQEIQDQMNMIPGLRGRGLDDLARLRGAEGLRGPTIMDMALSPADAAARLNLQASGASNVGDSSGNAPGGVGGAGRGRRGIKSDLYDRLADTNKKFPPPR